MDFRWILNSWSWIFKIFFLQNFRMQNFLFSIVSKNYFIYFFSFSQYRGQIKSFNNDIFATRGTWCLDLFLVCFHQPPSAPSIFCFLTDLAWLTIYRGRCRGSVKSQVDLSALWWRNFAHNDCPWYGTSFEHRLKLILVLWLLFIWAMSNIIDLM